MGVTSAWSLFYKWRDAVGVTGGWFNLGIPTVGLLRGCTIGAPSTVATDVNHLYAFVAATCPVGANGSQDLLAYAFCTSLASCNAGLFEWRVDPSSPPFDLASRPAAVYNGRVWDFNNAVLPGINAIGGDRFDVWVTDSEFEILHAKLFANPGSIPSVYGWDVWPTTSYDAAFTVTAAAMGGGQPFATGGGLRTNGGRSFVAAFGLVPNPNGFGRPVEGSFYTFDDYLTDVTSMVTWNLFHTVCPIGGNCISPPFIGLGISAY